MSSVCLSLVATLRCSGLSQQQAIGILVPPAVETFLLSFLIYSQWRNGRKHFLLIAESCIYLILCILDLSSKTTNSIATSLRLFPVYDRVIGGLSGIPIILYILFLYFLSRQSLIPLLPKRFQWLFKVLLAVLIPIILALTELGSLVGIGYRTLAPPSRELAIQFNSNLAKIVWTLFSSSALALMILYQAIVFVLCLFRIFRQWNPSSSSSGTPNPGRMLSEKGMDDNSSRFRSGRTGGYVWISVGVKLGAIEVLLGFIPNGFEMALARRLLRLLGRVIIAFGVFKGLNHPPTEMFRVVSIDSLEGAPTRRIHANPRDIRALIGAPMSDTFAKMSPTAAVFHNKLTKSYKGDQANLEAHRQALTAFDMSFVDEKHAGFGRAVPAAVMPALLAQGVAAPSTPQATFPQTFDDGDGKPPTEFKRPVFPKMVPHDKRVTVAYNGVVAPVLDIRFSAQTFTDAGTLLNKIKTSDSSSSDENQGRSRSAHRESALKALRSRSTPPTTRNARDKGGMATTPEEELDEGKIGLAITTSTPSGTGSSLPTRSNSGRPRRRSASASRANSGRKSSTSRPRNLNSNVSTQETLENPFTDASEVLGSSQSSSQPQRVERQGSHGSSGSDSILAIKDLSSQFPTTPNLVETPRPPKRRPSNAAPPSMEPSLSSSARMQDMAAMTRYRTQTQAKFGRSVEDVTVQQVSVAPATFVAAPAPVVAKASMVPKAPVVPLAPLMAAARAPRRADTNELSPTPSLNNDIAIRTRRRLRSHLGSISDSPSEAGAQYAIRPAPAKTHRHQKSAGSTSNPTTISSRNESPLFSAPMAAAARSGGGPAGGIRDTMFSPATEFNRDSILSMETPVVEKPMGRIARRALGIERFLDEEKEKDKDGVVYRNDALDELAEATYAADESNPTPPGSRPGSKRRPRSNMLLAMEEETAVTGKKSRPYSPPKPKRRATDSEAQNITVEDPMAREAFAAAWRTVSPKVPSPTVQELSRKMSSVNVKKTPAPVFIKKHSSGQSFKADVDEDYEAVLPPFTIGENADGSSSEYSPMPLPTVPSDVKHSRNDSAASGNSGMSGGSGSGREVNGDRELMRKSRALRVASMDSDVY